MSKTIHWTAKRIATLTEMWGAGELTQAIAKAIGHGCTRNAVIGKARRLNLPQQTRDHCERTREGLRRFYSTPRGRRTLRLSTQRINAWARQAKADRALSAGLLEVFLHSKTQVAAVAEISRSEP